MRFIIIPALIVASLYLSAQLWKVGDWLQGVDGSATELGGGLAIIMLAVPIFFGLLVIVGGVHSVVVRRASR